MSLTAQLKKLKKIHDERQRKYCEQILERVRKNRELDAVKTAYKTVPPKVWISPHFINVYTGGRVEISHLGSVKRGKTSARFTHDMSKRFLLTMEKYPDFKPLYFITLTYKYIQFDFKKSYDELEEFTRRLSRLTSKRCLYFWKREFQGRGAIHYHLITDFDWKMTALPSRKSFYNTVLSIWNSVTRQNTLSSTSVEPVRSSRAVGWYLALYLGSIQDKHNKIKQNVVPEEIVKAYDGIDSVGFGRWWGAIGSRQYAKVGFREDYIDGKYASELEKRLHEEKDSENYDYKEHKYHSNMFFFDMSKDKKLLTEALQNYDFALNWYKEHDKKLQEALEDEKILDFFQDAIDELTKTAV
ncbi:MAG: hypothetical protein K6E51_13950 [Treponema sp.]|nr:hypothetical protein [Treponema sp.]